MLTELNEARQILFRAFPCALPGETLYSVLARFHHRAGLRSSYFTGALALGFPKAVRYRVVPKGLASLCELIPDRLGSPRELLCSRTLGALYLRFMPEQKRERAIEHAASTVSRQRWGRHPFNWLSETHSSEHPLRYCPLCVQADRAQFGVGYWHLDHQLPAVWWCITHQCPLLAPINQHEGTWHLPPQHSSQCHSPFEADEFGLALARIVAAMCGTTPIEPGQAHLEVGRLMEVRDAIPKAWGKLERLEAIARKHITEDRLLLAHPFIQVSEDLRRLVIYKSGNHHPVKWALLLSALHMEGVPQADLLHALNGGSEPQLPGFPAAIFTPPKAYAVLAAGTSGKQCAADLGVSRAVVSRWLRNPALRRAWEDARWVRHRDNFREAVLEAIRAKRVKYRRDLSVACHANILGWMRKHDFEWLEQAVPVRKDGQNYQMPLPFVDILREDICHKHRRAILSAAGPSGKALQSVLLEKAKTSLAWCYRRDREWLSTVVSLKKQPRLTVLVLNSASDWHRLDVLTRQVGLRLGSDTALIVAATKAAAKTLGLSNKEMMRATALGRHPLFNHHAQGKPARIERWEHALRLVAVCEGLQELSSELPGGMQAWLDSFQAEFNGIPRSVIQSPCGLELVVQWLQRKLEALDPGLPH